MNGKMEIKLKDIDGDNIPDEVEIKLSLGKVALIAISVATSALGVWVI